MRFRSHYLLTRSTPTPEPSSPKAPMTSGLELLNAYKAKNPYNGIDAAWKKLRELGLDADKVVDPLMEDDEDEDFQFLVRLGELEFTFIHAAYNKTDRHQSKVECLAIEKKPLSKVEGYILPHEETGLDRLVELYRRRVRKALEGSSNELIEVTAWLAYFDEKKGRITWQD